MTFKIPNGMFILISFQVLKRWQALLGISHSLGVSDADFRAAQLLSENKASAELYDISLRVWGDTWKMDLDDLFHYSSDKCSY